MDGSDHKRDQGSHETNPDFGLDSDDVTRATASIVASAQVARTRIAAVQQLADCLLDQNLKYTRSLLEEYGVKSVGDQEGLRQLLVNALLSNQVPFHSAKELLHNVEPWPSHIYFFKAAPELCSQFDSFQKLKRMLSAKELVHLLNRDRTIEIPASMKIESIQFEDGVVRVYMISRRTWKMRDLSGDDVRTDRVLLCYKPCVARAASIFEIDTATGQAFLSIPQLQKKSSYSAEKDRLLRLLTSGLALVMEANAKTTYYLKNDSKH